MCYFAKYLQFKVSRIDIFFLQRPDIANPTASFSFLLLSIFFPAYSYQGITEKKKPKTTKHMKSTRTRCLPNDEFHFHSAPEHNGAHSLRKT